MTDGLGEVWDPSTPGLVTAHELPHIRAVLATRDG